MFSDAEPFIENSTGESPASGSGSSAASAAPAREESGPVVIPVHDSAEPAASSPNPDQTPASSEGAANAAAAPAEASAADAGAADGTPSAEELSELMDQYASPQDVPTEGEIVEGKVIAVTNAGVVVDFGRKSEGLVPAE